MKKFITLVLSLSVFISLTSCTADTVDENDSQNKSATADTGGDTAINPIKHR